MVPWLLFLLGTDQTLRSLCLWEGWDSLEPRVASLIAEDVAHGREPGPQNPYTTRLTGEIEMVDNKIRKCKWSQAKGAG